MRFSILSIVLFFSSATLFGCSNTDSENVKTKGIYASFDVSASNGAATAIAKFQVGGPTGSFLDLSSGDSITVNGLVLTRQELLGIIEYRKSVPYSEGGIYTFVFSREDEEPYTSTVTLTEAVTISSPTAGANATKGQSLSVQWNAGADASDSISVSLSKQGDDETGYSSSSLVSTASSHTIPASDTLTVNGGNIPATVSVFRERDGQMAEGLDGSIQSSQYDSVDITLVD
ncbi:MAG: hypothetical protein H6626_13825 [Pseudobdellovibrionaceae bacterium]|nr:hypothetical protein [Bdellovibrionales bacterium]USN47249.1 MAG: hypothetical protein H6626_13825 [Pseudobdellovibrionaceae bacterium]